jgi:hypothetical protein
MWLLFTILYNFGCHAEGPMIQPYAHCVDRKIVSAETITGFRSLAACEAEARRRWEDTNYATASRCDRLDGR